MRLEPVPYMTWAKTHMERAGMHNLASSGIRNLLAQEDLGLAPSDMKVLGHNEDGLPELRAAIAARFRVDPDRVLTAEGASGANFLVLAAALNPGDPVLLEEPYYGPLGSVLSAVGARVRRVAVDGAQGHAAILDAMQNGRGARNRAVVVTHPHNPTGAKVDDRLLRDLAAACGAQGALLIVDEAYREVLPEEPPGAAAHAGPSVVSTSSMTKVYGLSALRIGWAIGPPALIERAKRIHDNLGVNHAYIAESIGARLLGDPKRIARWREKLRARVSANRAALARLLASEPRFEGGMPEDGILCFPRWKGSGRLPDAETLCARADAEGHVVIVPGRFFQRPDRVRIAVGGPEEEVAAACAALARFLASS